MAACAYGVTAVDSQSHATEEKVGVLLLNLGGPETLNDVQPFLYNLFADPVCSIIKVFYNQQSSSFESILINVLSQDIIRLPRLFQFLRRPLAKLISVLRAPKSKEGYAAIGGGSPLRKITDEQVSICLFSKLFLVSFDFPSHFFCVQKAHSLLKQF